MFTNEAIAALTLLDHAEITQEFLYYSLMFFDWKKATDGDQKIKGRTMNKAKLKEMSLRVQRRHARLFHVTHWARRPP